MATKRKQKREKMDWELSIQERIDRAGWFQGSEHEWDKLPREEREARALAAVGCLSAYPSWQGPVDCCHPRCRLARKEIPQIALVNGQLRGEKTNWFRFKLQEGRTGRNYIAALFRHFRKQARETGVYDIWKLQWQYIVSAAVV